MATFIKNAEITDKIDRIINESREYIFIVSPYIQFSDRIISDLETASKQTHLTLIFGKDEISAKNELSKINHINCTILYKKNLHAKCYLNEKSAIITSMNLYAYSQINNEEMGMYLVKEEDEEAYLQCTSTLHNIIKSTDITLKEYNNEPTEKENEDEVEVASLIHENLIYFLKVLQSDYLCGDIKAYRFWNGTREAVHIHDFPKKDIVFYIGQSSISFDLSKIRQQMYEARKVLSYSDLTSIIGKYETRINEYLYQNDEEYQFYWNGYIVNIYWKINKKNCATDLLHKKYQILQQVSLIVQQAEIELSNYILIHSV